MALQRQPGGALQRRPPLGDARLCGTTASLCGVEAADYERDPFKLERAIACDLMLHAWMLTQSGIPVLYSGDEVGQLNDYSYHLDDEKREDSRYLHRGAFQWDLAAMRRDPDTRQGKQFMGLRRLEELRCAEPAFDARADVWTFDTGSPHVLGVGRWYNGRKLIAMFNFSNQFLTTSCREEGPFEELVYGGRFGDLSHVELPPTALSGFCTPTRNRPCGPFHQKGRTSPRMSSLFYAFRISKFPDPGPGCIHSHRPAARRRPVPRSHSPAAPPRGSPPRRHTAGYSRSLPGPPGHSWRRWRNRR